jgi:hypothetical protein
MKSLLLKKTAFINEINNVPTFFVSLSHRDTIVDREMTSGGNGFG